MKTMIGHRLITLNERLKWCVLLSCWFKRRLSEFKRFENIAGDNGHRLITLNGRLNLRDLSSPGFKRRLRAFKRFEKICASILSDVFPQNVSFPLHLFRGAEVDQVADGTLGDVHVVQKLLFMFRQEGLNRFQLNDDGVVRDKVGHIAFLQFPAFVEDFQCVLRRKRDRSVVEFDLQTLLVDFLAHARAHFFVNFKNRSHQSVAFITKIFSVLCHSQYAEGSLTNVRTQYEGMQGLWGNRLITLNGRLKWFVLLSCWFKRRLSEFKRFEKIAGDEVHRLITLNERLILGAPPSPGFKRRLRAFKRFDHFCTTG